MACAALVGVGPVFGYVGVFGIALVIHQVFLAPLKKGSCKFSNVNRWILTLVLQRSSGILLARVALFAQGFIENGLSFAVSHYFLALAAQIAAAPPTLLARPGVLITEDQTQAASIFNHFEGELHHQGQPLHCGPDLLGQHASLGLLHEQDTRTLSAWREGDFVFLHLFGVASPPSFVSLLAPTAALGSGFVFAPPAASH